MDKTPNGQIEPVKPGKNPVNSIDVEKSRPVSVAFMLYCLFGGVILMTSYSFIELGRYNQQEDHELSFFPYVAGLLHWAAGFSILSYSAYKGKKILSAVFAVAALITLTLLVQISQLDIHYSTSIADQIECQYDWFPDDSGFPGDSSCYSDFLPGWNVTENVEDSWQKTSRMLWRY